jgi:hypothetical protein
MAMAGASSDHGVQDPPAYVPGGKYSGGPYGRQRPGEAGCQQRLQHRIEALKEANFHS